MRDQRCPRCRTALDEGPVIYRCARCRRAVYAADVERDFVPRRTERDARHAA
ncbi:hypothetical protein [Spongiactinospora sp. TRM90649]|uniref:hypothetical protein n=1 Tax=Spongiactinospora sp. TRM90649 TaxID=3031114 RepID=UPI0023F81F13|nr:hypothetical protein [Spongiactinospora sp. TRM90649]MDF5757490.1 hypothetical protein [Spongiactinospora sp. TRM90649]